jgi:4-diphosphocytidyl-2-C-methyl-D-erythritol kinase
MFIEKSSNGSLEVMAPAKINLFLEVHSRRADGYHDINSAFQAVSLFDRLEFERTDTPEVSIELRGKGPVPTDETNLIAKAYRSLCEEFEVSGGLKVRLEKNIPVAAGLAGGSSDAAATILAANILYTLSLTRREMTELSARIGSDVPFFFTCGQALVSGRGEIVEETSFPTDYWLVLVTPAFGISTAESYAALKRGLTTSRNRFSLMCCPTAQKLIETIAPSGNDFEEVHFLSYPDLERIRDGLLRTGAQLARLTGSGPTVFGVFREAPDVDYREFFRRDDWQVHTVQPITLPRNYDSLEGGNRGDH